MNQKSAILEFAWCEKHKSVAKRIRRAKHRGETLNLGLSKFLTSLMDFVKRCDRCAKHTIVNKAIVMDYLCMKRCLRMHEAMHAHHRLVKMMLKELHQGTMSIGGVNLKRFDDFGKRVNS